jgi:hypothetical protein
MYFIVCFICYTIYYCQKSRLQIMILITRMIFYAVQNLIIMNLELITVLSLLN